jgi:tRNA-Thr(GGU) m(6)t(6)A37 methyltransferase TsaA
MRQGNKMKEADCYSVRPIGFIRSSLKERSKAPRQGFEGAPDAILEMLPAYLEGFHRLEIGDEILVITWLHQSRRDVLKVHPRDDQANLLTGVFLTRSPDRPNPIGLHRVTVLELTPDRILIGPIEAIDGTPVIDVKAVIRSKDN